MGGDMEVLNFTQTIATYGLLHWMLFCRLSDSISLPYLVAFAFLLVYTLSALYGIFSRSGTFDFTDSAASLRAI